MMAIQETLLKLRNRTGLSQAKFAKKFFIPLSTYEHWEIGMRKPPVYVVKLIEIVLDYEDKLKEK